MMALGRRRSAFTLAILLAFILAACGGPTGATSTTIATSASASGGRAATAMPALAAATATRGTPAVRSSGPVGDRDATTAVPLAVTPATGPAGTIFTFTGAGFPPDATLYVIGSGPDQPLILNRRVTVGADGLLRVEFDSLGRPPGAYSMAISRRNAQADALQTIAQVAFTISVGGTVPTLTLEPDRGACAVQSPALVVRGHSFPPNTTAFGLAAIQMEPYRASPVGAPVRVAADGTFVSTVFLTGCGPTTPAGTRFQINAVRFDGPIDPRRAVASATFVVAPSAAPLPILPTPSPDPR